MWLAKIKNDYFNRPISRLVLLSMLRHVLTAIGTLFVAYGYGNESIVEGLVGAVITILTTVWGANNTRELAKAEPIDNRVEK